MKKVSDLISSKNESICANSEDKSDYKDRINKLRTMYANWLLKENHEFESLKNMDLNENLRSLKDKWNSKIVTSLFINLKLNWEL